MKALVIGLCALTLTAAPAAAHTSVAPAGGLERQLAHHVRTAEHSGDVVRFFRTHRWLLSDPRFAPEARRQLASHRGSLARAQAAVERVRARLRALEQRRLYAARLRETPQQAICRVFGGYCRQALRVAHCESRFSTTARNGQYHGLFQMGSTPRRLFGHGLTAEAQARAAHRYFVRSGRDWSPWSCKP